MNESQKEAIKKRCCQEQFNTLPHTSGHVWQADHHGIPVGSCIKCGKSIDEWSRQSREAIAATPPAEVRPVGSASNQIICSKHNIVMLPRGSALYCPDCEFSASIQPPPTPPVDVATKWAKELAMDSAHIPLIAKYIQSAITEATAALSSQLELARKENGELRKDKERLDKLERLMVNIEITENVAGNIERFMVAACRANIDMLEDAAKGKGV